MLRFLTAGESHGPCLTGIIEGLPAGLPLSPADINTDLARRQVGFGAGGRMKIEKDEVQLLGGIGWNGPGKGVTTGGPIALRIENRDWANWEHKTPPLFSVPRPGHTDLAGGIKYGHLYDMRLILERSSARETAMRVAIGAVARKLLGEFGIRLGCYVIQLGPLKANLPDDLPYEERFARAEANDVRCPDLAQVDIMREYIRNTVRRRDTVGGVFEIVALGVPPGLGSHVHWDRKLDGRLAQAVMSIPAVKGVEIGPAFDNAARYGTEVHDEIFLEDGLVTRHTNRAGGLEGGITTGQPVVVRAALKPIATTLNPLRSVDLVSGEPTTTNYERSDFTAVTRGGPIGEAVVAWVLAEALLEKVGGDSLAEMRPRVEQLRQAAQVRPPVPVPPVE
ncbi:MAG: chorismate synthase [Anaerolineae bacterium]|nr:chorismate synthase [Anaerolineae bacterium]